MRRHHLHALLALGLCCASARAQERLAYIIDSDLDRLFSLSSNGAATLVGSTAGILTDPAGLAWQAEGRLLWTIDFAGGEVGTVDTATAQFTHRFTAVPGSGWQGIDRDAATGQFWLINGDGFLYRLDPTSGITTRVGATGVPLLTALESDASGALWGIGFQNGVLYRLDKTTGAATQVVTTAPANMQGLSFGPDGRLFGTNSTTDSLYLINTTTGTTSLTGAHGAGVRFPKGLEITFSLASSTRSGAGCPPAQALSYYELFAARSFDLPNQALQMAPLGTGYQVSRSASAFVPPTNALTPRLADDGLSSQLRLPFSFPYPGGATSLIRVCSNGFIHLNATATSTDYSPSAAEALNGGPRLFPLWMDLNPSAPASGDIYFDVDPARGIARITWLGIPEFQGTGTSTFQVELHASGAVDYRWQNAGNLGANNLALVGFSPGAANLDLGSRDISASLPFLTASDRSALEQEVGRPLLGQLVPLRLSGIPAGSIAGVEMFGLPLPGNGIDLSGAGMTGCSQYLLPVVVSLPISVANPTLSTNLWVPNDQSLIGGIVGLQAAVIAPGANPAGVVTSGLVTLRIGEL
jgi:hypothetical protein